MRLPWITGLHSSHSWYNCTVSMREQNFRDKFASAANHLGCSSGEVVSLKFRDNVGSYGEYHELLQRLEHVARLHHNAVDGNFQGRAYLIRASRSKVIIVEHETGLEVLYVAGSIASLIGLIPLILNVWNWIRDGEHRSHLHRSRRHFETRQLDKNGNLIENHNPDIGMFGPEIGDPSTAIFLSAVEGIEERLHVLEASVEDLSKRLQSLEMKTSGEPGHGSSKKAARRRKKGQ
jgi:hypothetical protein